MLSTIEWNALRLSLQVAVCAVVCSLPVAVLLGYVLARYRFRLKWLVETAVDLPLVLPPVVTGYLLLLIFGRNGPMGALLEAAFGIAIGFTWLGAAVASAVVSFPLLVRAIRISFSHVDPRLESAARSLGAGPLDAFFSVSLPLAYRGVIAGCVLAFARSVGEFGATIMLAGNIPGRTQTIPLAVFSIAQQPGGVEQSWRLVMLSVLLACAALLCGAWFERADRKRGHD